MLLRCIRYASVATLALSLAACSNSGPNAATMVSAAATSPPAAIVTRPQQVDPESRSDALTYATPQHANAANAIPAASRIAAAKRSDDRGRSIRENCGGTTVVLQCTGSACTSTSLQLMTDHGKVLTVANPSGLESYSAVGLGCAVASDQTPYVVVQYGELPTGCEFCEWFHVLDAKGQWLTHSVPAILVGRALPGTRDQVPNNREFNAFSRKWKLGKPHITFIR